MSLQLVEVDGEELPNGFTVARARCVPWGGLAVTYLQGPNGTVYASNRFASGSQKEFFVRIKDHVYHMRLIIMPGGLPVFARGGKLHKDPFDYKTAHAMLNEQLQALYVANQRLVGENAQLRAECRRLAGLLN